jgi:serine/threonine protein kinase
MPAHAPQVNHMAPELLRYGKASTAADVYSFGIMMWELLTGQVAFKGWQWGAILEHVALGDSPGRLPVPEGAPEGYLLLMEACWGQDPAKRPAFSEVSGLVGSPTPRFFRLSGLHGRGPTA